MKYIFIDTNMYRDLLVKEKLASRIIPVLEKLIKNGYTLILPQQVLDEIERNRFKGNWSIKKNTKKLEDSTKILRENQNAFEKDEAIANAISTIEVKLSTMKEEEDKKFKDEISETGTVQQTINQIVSIATILPDSTSAMDRALLRVRKGNPPHKFGSKEDILDIQKICDCYIWEKIKEFLKGIKKCEEFLFFSRNTDDWCIETSEGWIFHPFLQKEIFALVNVNVIYRDSLDEMPEIGETIKTEVEAIESVINEADVQNLLETELPQRLRNSNTWKRTDLIIEEFLPLLNNVSADQVKKILDASLDNAQFSSGPYNQVLMASKAQSFFGKLYRIGKEHNHPVEMWTSFYTGMDKTSRDSFGGLKVALQKRDYYYVEEENKMIYIPF